MRSILFVFSFSLVFGFLACKNDPTTEQTAPETSEVLSKTAESEVQKSYSSNKTVTILSADEFETYIKDHPNTPFIDLRPEDEYKRAHIGRAINIPFVLEGFENKIKHLAGAPEIAIYCANGIRSTRAAEAFEKLKVQKIMQLDQGIYSWAVAHKMQVGERSKKK